MRTMKVIRSEYATAKRDASINMEEIPPQTAAGWVARKRNAQKTVQTLRDEVKDVLRQKCALFVVPPDKLGTVVDKLEKGGFKGVKTLDFVGVYADVVKKTLGTIAPRATTMTVTSVSVIREWLSERYRSLGVDGTLPMVCPLSTEVDADFILGFILKYDKGVVGANSLVEQAVDVALDSSTKSMVSIVVAGESYADVVAQACTQTFKTVHTQQETQ